jgi:hypothetical protein
MKSSDAHATSATLTPSEVWTEHSVMTSPRRRRRERATTTRDWTRPWRFEAGLIKSWPNRLSSILNGRFLSRGFSMTLAQSMPDDV